MGYVSFDNEEKIKALDYFQTNLVALNLSNDLEIGEGRTISIIKSSFLSERNPEDVKSILAILEYANRSMEDSIRRLKDSIRVAKP
ncbi:hypothetical protein ACVWYG_003645 [Pedobacter sp. UYEF25]